MTYPVVALLKSATVTTGHIVLNLFMLADIYNVQIGSLTLAQHIGAVLEAIGHGANWLWTA